jgi:proteasome assembly chaperone (PAC2) family protein
MNINEKGITSEKLTSLNKPLLIAGFDGWGNALGVSRAMIEHLIQKMDARQFAQINPDMFYRYDAIRPLVNIVEGKLKEFVSPGGSFYVAKDSSAGRDIVILNATEPNLCWFRFADELFLLCKDLGIETVITLGSMYDNVLHNERIISGVASNNHFLKILKKKKVLPIHYQGPGAFHSIIQSEGKKKGFNCVSLWCHCPFYLEGITHFGLLSSLASMIAYVGEFKLNTDDLEKKWEELSSRIHKLIENNSKIQDIIKELQDAKATGLRDNIKKSLNKDEKVINIKDFLDPA